MAARISADRRELVISLYERGKMFKDISRLTGITARGCCKIVEAARKSGDARAALRRPPEAKRALPKRPTPRWGPPGTDLPSSVFIHGMSDRSFGGIDADFDEGRW